MATVFLARGAAPIVRTELGGNALQSRSVSGCHCETNDSSVAILLSYGTACVLLAGDAKAREEHIANRCYTRP